MPGARAFTPELMENGRYRYEETDEPVVSIAVDFAVHERTFRAYTKKWGWRQRKDRPPVDLSPALRALAEAEATAAPPVASADEAADPPVLAPEPAADATLSLIARLHGAVDKELAAVERMRAYLGHAAQEPADAERTARTLATLARTLNEVQRLRGVAALPMDQDDDDIPTDIDEFRRAIARRMDAFVESWGDGSLRDAGVARVDEESHE
jgi:hypothetical protein